MSTQKRTGDYHVSSHLRGSFKEGAWHCAHGNRAWEDKAGPNSNYYMMRYWKCDPRKRGINEDDCRFWLWEDHLPEAMKYHDVPEGAIQINSPSKRRRNGDIRDWVRTPKTPRTRDALVEREDSMRGLYDTPTPSPPDEDGPSNRHRDSSPTPVSRRPRASGAPPPSTTRGSPEREPSQQVTPPLGSPRLMPATDTLRPTQDNLSQTLPSQILSTGSLLQTQVASARQPPPQSVPATGSPLAPAPAIQPETPRRPIGRRLFETPGTAPLQLTDAPPSGARKLVTPELDAYNVVIKALAAANVKLSLRGQTTLREIIREDAYTLDRNL